MDHSRNHPAGRVDLQKLEPVDVRPQLKAERAELLQLLSALTPDEWTLPTAAEKWHVKAVALHLLDVDLGWLSRLRDRDTSGQLEVDDYRSFVKALDAKNQRWVTGAKGLSPRVLIDLLEWSGKEMDQWWATINLMDQGGVIWASNDSVPEWFDIAQDLTERWVHQMQIREAVGQAEDYAEKYLPIVLQTFVWAMRHQYRAIAPVGSRVNIDLGLKANWNLECVEETGRWTLNAGTVEDARASVSLESDAAWRLMTGAEYDRSKLTVGGDASLVQDLLKVRSIIV